MRTYLLLLFLTFRLYLAAQPFFLYPGDTNNDGVCNYLDLIPVGLAYGDQGPRRPLPANDWLPVPFQPWTGPLPPLPASELDRAFANAYTHQGTSGLDTVNANDVLILQQHYGEVQSPSAPSFPPPTDYLALLPEFPVTPPPAIRIRFSADTVDVLDTFYAHIEFTGTDSPDPAYQGVMAIGLRLKYASINVEDMPPRILFDTLSTDLMGLGATYEQAVSDRSPLPGKDTLELAVSGYRNPAFLTDRPVAAVEYIVDLIIRSNAADTVYKPFWIEFVDVVLVDTLERRITGVLTHSDTVVLRQIITSAGEPEWQQGIRLFPNPARDHFTVSAPYGLLLDRVVLFDARGRELRLWKGPLPGEKMRLEGLPQGWYNVEISTGRGVLWRKLTLL